MARRTTPSRRSLVSLLAVGMLSILAFSAIPRASADGDIGITVNVEVLGPSDSASATTTSTATSTGQPTSGTSSTASSGTTSSGAPTASVSTAPGGETSIGGILYVSGLTIRYTPSINPFDGKVDLVFTVRNTYSKPIDGKAVFWVTNWLGGSIGHEVKVNVNVKPGETETVTATIRGVGQWGVITGHATYTPPKFLDAITLTAVTRSSVVVYPPWFPISVISAGCAIWWGWRRRFADMLWDLLASRGGRR